MNPRQPILALSSLVIVSTIFVHSAQAEEQLNGRQAANLCKQEISTLYSGEHKIKFDRNPASSLKSGKYRFWINSTEKSADSKSRVRYLCEITRSGELMALTREKGRWKI